MLSEARAPRWALLQVLLTLARLERRAGGPVRRLDMARAIQAIIGPDVPAPSVDLQLTKLQDAGWAKRSRDGGAIFWSTTPTGRAAADAAVNSAEIAAAELAA